MTTSTLGRAGVLPLAVLLAGCPAGAPTTTAPSSAPVASPAAVASAPAKAATPAPGAAIKASATPGPADGAAGGATAAVAVSAPPPNGKTVVVGGFVYDEAGAPVDGATVTLKALTGSYSATAVTAGGSYVFNAVPAGVVVALTATRERWTSRTRTFSFQETAQGRNSVDFGGSDAQGAPYFISKYPEIADVSPAADATGVDPSSVSYQLTLSEPLDATNQTRFANALRLIPANSYAAPDNDGAGSGANYQDLKDQQLTDRPVDPDPAQGYSSATRPNHPVAALVSGTPYDYAIKNGTLFLDDANTRATVTWDATGTVATLGFKVPLQADRTNQARYQLALVAGAERIVDPDSHPLGMDKNGEFLAGPGTTGVLLHATIKQPDLSLSSGSRSASKRWLDTHQDAAGFSVQPDTTAPNLVSAAYRQAIRSSSRFELRFDQALATYNGRPGGHVGAAIADGSVLAGISFMVSDQAGGTAKYSLGGGPGYGLDPLGTDGFGKAERGPDLEVEFGLTTPAAAGTAGTDGEPTLDPSVDVLPYGTDVVQAEGNAANTGKYLLAVDPADPRTLFIYVVNVARLFDPRVAELRVRAEGVPDPTGNAITADDADAQQVAGTDVQ